MNTIIIKFQRELTLVKITKLTKKTSSELKRKNMQKKSHTVSHRHVVNDGKTNSILNKVDNANKQLNKSKCSCLDKLDNKVYPRMK